MRTGVLNILFVFLQKVTKRKKKKRGFTLQCAAPNKVILPKKRYTGSVFCLFLPVFVIFLPRVRDTDYTLFGQEI